MANVSEIKNGLCIEFNGSLFAIISFQHVKPGKGPAFVRTKLKNLETGKVIDNTFAGSAKLNTIRIERRPHQYLYQEGSGFVFMHNETFEQISIDAKLIDNPLLLKEGLNVDIVVHADKEMPLQVEFPPFVVMEVTYTEPGIKGDTSSSTALKKATLDTGLEIMVPLFVNQNDIIKVDTRDITYAERVKS